MACTNDPAGQRPPATAAAPRDPLAGDGRAPRSAADKALRGLSNALRFPRTLRCRMLRGLPAAEQAAFIDACTVHHFPHAQEVLAQGQPAPGMWIVAQGRLEVSALGLDGNRAVIHIAGPGETVGESEAVGCAPCPASCSVTAGTTLLLCPTPRLALALGRPEILRNFAGIFCERMKRDNDAKLIDQFQTAEQRICSYLRQLARQDATIRHNQDYIATMAGASRQTVNRILGTLRDDGIIALAKGEIRLLDPAGLERRITG